MSLSTSAIKSEFNDGKKQIQHASADISKEFKNFLSDIESLVKETNNLTGEELAKAKAKLTQRIDAAKEQASEAGLTIVEQARKTAAVTNNYVHEQPWAAIGAGAAISFLLGFLLARQD